MSLAPSSRASTLPFWAGRLYSRALTAIIRTESVTKCATTTLSRNISVARRLHSSSSASDADTSEHNPIAAEDSPSAFELCKYCGAARENARKALERRLEIEQATMAAKFSRVVALSAYDEIQRLHRFKDELNDQERRDVALTNLEQLILDKLEGLGVERIPVAQCDKFDPKYHEALMVHPADRGFQGQFTTLVDQVVRDGFILKATKPGTSSMIIRPAMVVTRKERLL